MCKVDAASSSDIASAETGQSKNGFRLRNIMSRSLVEQRITYWTRSATIADWCSPTLPTR